MAVGDFIGFCEANMKNALLVMSEAAFNSAKEHYEGHRYNEPFLREYEPSVLVHSTPMDCWTLIKRDGILKSWNLLETEKPLRKNILLEYNWVIQWILATISCSAMVLPEKLL